MRPLPHSPVACWRANAFACGPAVTLSTHPRPRSALHPARHPRTYHTPASRGRGPTLLGEGSRRCGRQQARDSRRTCTLATLGRRPPSIRLYITLSEREPAAGAPLPAFSCPDRVVVIGARRATTSHTSRTPCPQPKLALQVQPAHPRAARPRPCGRQHGRRHVPSGGVSSMLGGGLQRRQQSARPVACGARRGR